MRADGTVFPVELAIAEVRLADRRLFTAYLRDISERRRAEQALQESERRYRAVVEDQTELIARYDAEFRLTFANRAYARAFGAEPEALVGADFFHAMPPGTGARPCVPSLLALTPEHPLRTGEHQQALGDGAVRWLAWTNRALFDASGRRVGYQSVGRDITEARRAEQALRESEARFFGAAESLPDGLMILDAEDRIVFYNDRHRELLPPALRRGCAPGSASRTSSARGWRAARSTIRTWGRTTRSKRLAPRAERADRARAQARGRPLGAHPRGPDAGRRAGDADPRHHRAQGGRGGAPPERGPLPRGGRGPDANSSCACARTAP